MFNYRKGIIALLLANLFCFSQLHSQSLDRKIDNDSLFSSKKEVFFSFRNDIFFPLEKLSSIISISKIFEDSVYAYSNKAEFIQFLNFGLDYKILQSPGELFNESLTDFKTIIKSKTWNYYPTYGAYDSLMYKFQADYPQLCKIQNIGTLSSGRKILVAVLSDSVIVKKTKPQFLYTSTMHGDEVTGYVLLLHLIDYLLSNYGVNPKITFLMNNIEIFINPLANPNGTYAGGNNTLTGATRNNANGFDLNRNFPDPLSGHTNPIQPETQFFINFAKNNNFVMAANFHGGAELLNYPWDTWAKLPADDIWWNYVCKEYADTAQFYSPSGYFDDFGTGVINGYQWYPIHGSRQDYMNYFHHCREVTAEISNAGMPPSSQLTNYWEWNYRSLLNYLEQCYFGIRGIVTDSVSGNPIRAMISIDGFDKDSSQIYSAMPLGNYHRPLIAGSYSITFSSAGYIPKTISNITVLNKNTYNLNVKMVPNNIGIKENDDSALFTCFPNPVKDKLKLSFNKIPDHTVTLIISGLNGIRYFYSNSFQSTSQITLDLSNYNPGFYILTVISHQKTHQYKIIKN